MSQRSVLERPFKHPLIFLAVTGADHPGIIASVTEFLYRQGANLEDVSMTLLDKKFSMMLIFQLSAAKRAQMEKGIVRLEKKTGLAFFWKQYEVKRPDLSKKINEENSEYYLIRALGPDQTGIVYHISRLMAKVGLNITDLHTKVIGQSSKPLYALLMETPVPKRLAPKLNGLKKRLMDLGRKLKIEIQLTRVESIAF